MGIKRTGLAFWATLAIALSMIVPTAGATPTPEYEPSFAPAQDAGKDGSKRKKSKKGKKKASKREKKASDKSADKEPEGDAMPAISFEMKDIDGKKQDLRELHGSVVLFVNTASKCGFTPQYAALEELYQRYRERKFVVIAVPANNFGGQEPGTNEEIKSFCLNNFAVTFPIMGKVSVKGDDICPLYKYLTDKKAGHKFGGEVPWNFNKFLIGRHGEIVGRFKHAVHPVRNEKFIAAVEKALEAPIPEGAAKEKEPPKPQTGASRG